MAIFVFVVNDSFEVSSLIRRISKLPDDSSVSVIGTEISKEVYADLRSYGISVLTRSDFGFRGTLKARKGLVFETGLKVHIKNILGRMLFGKNDWLVLSEAIRFRDSLDIEELQYAISQIKKKEPESSIFVDRNLGVDPRVLYDRCESVAFSNFRSKTDALLEMFFTPAFLASKLRVNLFGSSEWFDIGFRLHSRSRYPSTPFNTDGIEVLPKKLRNRGVDVRFICEEEIEERLAHELALRQFQIINWGRRSFKIFGLKALSCWLLSFFVMPLWILFGFFLPSRTIKLITRLFIDKVRWHSFHSKFKIKAYTCINNKDIFSFYRNSIFYNYEVHSAHYSHSWSDYVLLSESKKELLIQAETFFNNYSHNFVINAIQSRPNGKNIVVGSLLDISRPNKMVSNQLEAIAPGRLKVACFPCSFGVKQLNQIDRVEKFIEFLAGVIHERVLPDSVLIFKPKGEWRSLVDGLSKHSYDLLNRLIAGGDLVAMSEEMGASDIVSSCDLTISMAFTSPSFDALSFSRPGVIWYDDGSEVATSYLAPSPMMVSSVQELSAFVAQKKSAIESSRRYLLSDVPIGRRSGYNTISANLHDIVSASAEV